jgi:glycerate kinase
MKLAIVSGIALAISCIAGTGYLVIRGAGAAAGTALTWLEPVVRSSLPTELDLAEIHERLDTALARMGEGRIDRAALRETVLWLPGALLDGMLDEAEIEALAGKLDRVIAAPAQVES